MGIAVLTKEQIVEEARRRYVPFIQERVNCGARQRDLEGSPIPRELLCTAATIGLIAHTIPAEVGGAGRSWWEWGHMLYEIGYHCEDTAFPLLLDYCGTVTKLLYEAGRPDLIDRYVRPMARGECFGAFCWSEGQDPFSFRTSIRQDGETYVVDGEKVPVAGGLTADLFMTFGRSAESGDVAVVLVERGDAGVEITPYPAVGLRSAGIARARFHSVRVPAERLLLATDGVSYGQRFLNERRLGMPCWALGRMRTLFERCVAELCQRQRYRLPVTEMQAVQAAIGRMFVALETSSLVVAHALERVRCEGHDSFWDTAIAISKYYVVNQALDVCRTAQQILGGASVFLESPYERYMRDFQCLVPLAGTQAILEVDLGILAIGEIERRLVQSRLEVHA